MSVSVITVNHKDEEKIIISEVSNDVGRRLVENLKEIFPREAFWVEED